MEIGRWSFEKITSISDRYRNFREFLAQVLEGDRSLVAPDTSVVNRPRFDVEPIENVKSLSPVKVTGRKAALQIFNELAPYFEAGFLLRNSPTRGTYTLDSMFLFGQVFTPPAAEAPIVEMRLPKTAGNFGRVFRTRASPVLKVFRLDHLSGFNEASAFAFAPAAKGDGTQLTFVLVCDRPHPWQVGAVEAAHHLVAEVFPT